MSYSFRLWRVCCPHLVLFASMLVVPRLGAQSTAVLPAAPATTAPTQAIQIQNGARRARTQRRGPLAIVPLDSKEPGSAAMVTGALQVSNGRAMIASNGAITSGATTTEVTLAASRRAARVRLHYSEAGRGCQRAGGRGAGPDDGARSRRGRSELRDRPQLRHRAHSRFPHPDRRPRRRRM